jgi:hypothetical protein
MFHVDAESCDTYLAFDPVRADDLVQLDALIVRAAPQLTRYFHLGTPDGTPGMRFRMIGYGPFHYCAKGGALVEWPIIGVALQKNYISAYLAVTHGGRALIDTYRGRLGEWRSGVNNFSFRRFDDLDLATVTALVADAAAIVQMDPQNPVRGMQGGECRLPIPTNVA